VAHASTLPADWRKKMSFALALELANRMFPESRFDSLWQGPIRHVKMPDEDRKLFINEVRWLMDGQYPKFLEMVGECFEELLTEEEMAQFIQVYKEYPWIAEKQTQLGEKLSDGCAQMFAEISAQALNNLNEGNGHE
jgi:hypothetical protein